jgi:hypothetical protein
MKINFLIFFSHFLLDEVKFPRQSLCEIELDASATDISNPNMQKGSSYKIIEAISIKLERLR